MDACMESLEMLVKSMKNIGPDLGNQWNKYFNGVKADNGSIYCLPTFRYNHFLKVTPKRGEDTEVLVLKDQQLPKGHWIRGSLANDGCIYYLPHIDGRVLKLDPNDNDSLSLVGNSIHTGYIATALEYDGCIYGISNKMMIKFNPADCSVASISNDRNVDNVDRCHDRYHRFEGGVLAEDGFVYTANEEGQILKIDLANNNRQIIWNSICKNKYHRGWGSPVLGADKCIYFPPSDHEQVLKYNPATQNTGLIGELYGDNPSKWKVAVLASDGFIYCIPSNEEEILQIDSRHINEQVLAMIENL